MKTLTYLFVVFVVILGISPQDSSAMTLYNNEPKLKVMVEVFHDFDYQKIDNIKVFVMHKNIGLNDDLEFKTYKRIIEDNFQNLNYSIADQSEDADYIVEIDYGIDFQERYSNYPIYRYVKPKEKTIFESKKNNFEFKIQTKSPSGRVLIGYRTFKDSFYSRHLYMDIYSADTNTKIYQGKADSDGKINSLPYIINGLAFALFNDFPGNNSVLNTYEISEEIYNPEAYLQKQNNKFLKIQDAKKRNWSLGFSIN